MTRIPFDQNAKTLVRAALADAVTIHEEKPVKSEPGRMDLWLEPKPNAELPPDLLGRIAARPLGLEYFYDRPRFPQAISCLGKLIAAYEEERRRARIRRVQAPKPLFILSAHSVPGVLTRLGMRPLDGWPAGVYRMSAPGLPLHAVIAAELPRTRDTLLLRLLGRGRVFEQAMDDARALPRHAWQRGPWSEMVRMLRSALERDFTPRTPEEEAVTVSVTTAYESIKAEGRAEGRVEGRAEGRVEGQRSLLVQQLTRRFGSLAPEVIARIDAADASELVRFADRVLDAKSLEDVLAE